MRTQATVMERLRYGELLADRRPLRENLEVCQEMGWDTGECREPLLTERQSAALQIVVGVVLIGLLWWFGVWMVPIPAGYFSSVDAITV